MDPRTIATLAASTIRSAVDTVDANPFADIGHANNADALALKEFGVEKATKIADGIDRIIAEGNGPLVLAIAQAAASFIGQPIPALLAALVRVPQIAALLA